MKLLFDNSSFKQILRLKFVEPLNHTDWRNKTYIIFRSTKLIKVVLIKWFINMASDCCYIYHKHVHVSAVAIWSNGSVALSSEVIHEIFK